MNFGIFLYLSLCSVLKYFFVFFDWMVIIIEVVMVSGNKDRSLK